MSYYSVPLFISFCIYIYIIRINRFCSNDEKKRCFFFAGANFIELIIFVMVNPSLYSLYIGFYFLFIADMNKKSCDFLVEIQNRERLFGSKFIYCIMMVQWMILVIAFALESIKAQSVLFPCKELLMQNFRLILLLVIILLTFILYKTSNRSIQNKYFIYFTYTISFILFICSMIKIHILIVFSFFFDIVMCFYVVSNTIKIFKNQDVKDIAFVNLNDNKVNYFIIVLWSIYWISVVFMLKDVLFLSF